MREQNWFFDNTISFLTAWKAIPPIDNLDYKVFAADDYINPLLVLGSGKEIENVRLSLF